MVSDSELTAVVPAAAVTGVVLVVIPTGILTATSNFKVLPTTQSISPPSGPVGTSPHGYGTGSTGATKVTIGGKAATFTLNSSRQITVTMLRPAIHSP